VSLLGITNNYRIPILDSRDLNEGWYHVISDDMIPLETLPTRLYIYNDETYTIRMSLPFNFNRMGGDEFVCIIKDFKDSSIDTDLKVFNDQCLDFDQKTPYKFNVSVSVSIYDSNTNISIEEALIK